MKPYYYNEKHTSKLLGKLIRKFYGQRLKITWNWETATERNQGMIVHLLGAAPEIENQTLDHVASF